MRLYDTNLSTLQIGFDIPNRSAIRIPNVAVHDTFAIDPSKTDFSYGELTRIATGTALYKCQEWNFTNAQCTGKVAWQLL